MDRNIEVADGHQITAKQKVQVQINMYGDNGDTFITTLHNVLLTPYLWDSLFSIITLMNSGHVCLFQKGSLTVYFGDKEKNAVTLPHSVQRIHAFLGKKANVKIKEITI